MTPVFSDVFTEMAVLLLLAAVIGAIGVRLRQPLIVAFIAVGILVGLGRFGSGLARELRQRGHRVLGVDFDPDLVRRQGGLDYPVRYGDRALWRCRRPGVFGQPAAEAARLE